MHRFKKILVGVDLSQGDRLVATELPPPSQEAVDRALWLAKLNGARLRYLYSLDVSATAQRMIEESEVHGACLIDEARDVLNGLVLKAAAAGVVADVEVCFGKSWHEIIRNVLRGQYDLVVAGTRHAGAGRPLLVGSTGIKLLRKCPCPVWITQPQPGRPIRSVLVAHCLRPVGDFAMELGCWMAELQGAQLHVLHSLEFPELETALPARISAEKMQCYRADAEDRIRSQLAKHNFAIAPKVHVVTDPPEFSILQLIVSQRVELVVMGTIARSGIAGFFTGNTAERLLPQLPCSVLAVKPADFVSPVSL